MGVRSDWGGGRGSEVFLALEARGGSLWMAVRSGRRGGGQGWCRLGGGGSGGERMSLMVMWWSDSSTEAEF